MLQKEIPVEPSCQDRRKVGFRPYEDDVREMIKSYGRQAFFVHFPSTPPSSLPTPQSPTAPLPKTTASSLSSATSSVDLSPTTDSTCTAGAAMGERAPLRPYC